MAKGPASIPDAMAKGARDTGCCVVARKREVKECYQVYYVGLPPLVPSGYEIAYAAELLSRTAPIPNNCCAAK